MRSRYRIALNGTHLDSLDKNILILDIGYPPMEKQINQNRIALLDGYDFDDEYLEKQTVTVTFELHIYDVAERNKACRKVNEWASAGGVLTTNDRDDQILDYVRCEQYASIESAKNWTDPLTLVFATTYVPYWQSASVKTLKLSGKTPSGTLKMNGNTGYALVSVEAVANANITKYSVTVGDTKIELEGLSIPNGKKLIIDYINGRILRIRADGKSVIMKPTSSDLLLAKCGANSKVSISANNKVTTTITARGLCL